MLLSEPPRSQYDLNFRVLGIPVRVHPMFWAVSLLLGLGGNQKPVNMLLWVGACFVSILVHELGHALAARAHGWSPWITLYFMGGLASYQPTYYRPQTQILISLAGPVAGFAFAGFIAALVTASGHAVHFDPAFQFRLPILWEFFDSDQLNRLVFDLFYINIFWGLLNLLPINPLDGGHIAQEVLSVANPRDGARQALWLSVIVSVGLAILAITKLGDRFLLIFFLYFAYMNYMTLQQTYGPGGGLGRFR